VLDSGPAPEVAISSPAEGSAVAADLLTVEARINERGKGVGRVEWRVNGVTTAVASKPAGEGPEYRVTQQLALDPGEKSCTRFKETVPQSVPVDVGISAKCWSEWQDLNLRPPRPERGALAATPKGRPQLPAGKDHERARDHPINIYIFLITLRRFFVLMQLYTCNSCWRGSYLQNGWLGAQAGCNCWL
jgi:Bacterial Ig domain